MARPYCSRRLNACPPIEEFIPFEQESAKREPVLLSLDEFEALRLADYLGMYHEEAGQEMGVSRPTFSRIVEQARHKVTMALVEGRPIRITGGPVDFVCRQKSRGSGRHCHRHCKRKAYFLESDQYQNESKQ
ncbi:MAG TPA: DUF134 domain-containing protein [Candidatus Hydrogenedens sp.]|nr:DUF134 domain-containing protein [Candidatus Hydrogenedens sp.]HOL21090.1 DUF134 domain-containing protein [Candidatus Hydrogenedens sp.]HPP58854.1 DUF134 domain-containing protein [Candidatus Hydrogenedens sp.]